MEENDEKLASKRPANDSANKKRRKRKSKHNSGVKIEIGNDAPASPNKKRKLKNNPLNGMVVAVSTLGVKGQSHLDSQSSYKAISEQCQKLGASVTGQVHRRVACLVCNESAVRNSTQRVRKAIKKKVPLVDVAWIRKCRENDKIVDMDPFRLDELALQVVESRKAGASSQEVEVTDASAAEVDAVPDSAWTEPKSLGCCCVCHENGDDNCPWCPDCNV